MEMHQTKKGNEWHFGMKAHIGVDAESGLVHTVVVTAANVNDVTQAHALLHGEETDVHADAGYQGVDKREENFNTAVTWNVAMRPGKHRARPLARARRAHQGEDSSEGRASVSRRQESVSALQGALSRPGKERSSTTHAVRLGQPRAGSTAADGARHPSCVRGGLKGMKTSLGPSRIDRQPSFRTFLRHLTDLASFRSNRVQ